MSLRDTPVAAETGISIVFFLSILSQSIRFVREWNARIIRFNPPTVGELEESISKNADVRQIRL
jgi:hypothetical protein